MSQLRQDISTREWVIIATDRAKRPKDFTEKEAEVRETTSANCPFCEGNESATPPEVLAYREPGTEPDKPGWRVRVIPNKFPALMPAGSERRKKQGVYQTMDGLGKHEVIVETPQHNKTIGTMEVGEVEEVILAYRDR
jgi:UDPglucose--hexose-1-phosphate uridylyltransferase